MMMMIMMIMMMVVLQPDFCPALHDGISRLRKVRPKILEQRMISFF